MRKTEKLGLTIYTADSDLLNTSQFNENNEAIEGFAVNEEAARLLHEANRLNPHGVTKAQVGLGNADNTSDIDKPISTSTQAALNIIQEYLDSHTSDKGNPHSTTKEQVGLGNVDDTSDIAKPVSTAQQTAIDTSMAQANAFTLQKIADLINGAPESMDTLKEVADAIAENEDVMAALDAAIGTKANQAELDTHTGNTTIHITATERANWNDANSKKHAHSNKSVLDGITSALIEAWNNAAASGSGDMLKSVYDTNNDGIVDNAAKVNGHTVDIDVPANAKLTDTTYGVATESDDGLMTSAMVAKLNRLSDEVKLQNITITVAEFAANTDDYASVYPYCADYAVSGMTATCMVINLSYSPPTLLSGCMASQGQTLDGLIRLYATSMPKEDIVVDNIVWKEVG